MWVVIKANKKSHIEILKDNIKKRFSSVQFYIPKIKINEKKNKKKTYFVLGKYLFCKHQDFIDERKLTKIKFLNGLEQILTGNIFHKTPLLNLLTGVKNMRVSMVF